MDRSQAKQITDILSSHSTCLISDILLRLNIKYGGYLPGLTMWSPDRQCGTTRLVGAAYTVKFVRTEDVDAPTPEKHYIDTIPEGSVIFISAPKGIPNAVYGGLMTHRAKFSKAAGTVVDGNFRDLDEQRQLNWPLFARGVATPAYHGTARPSEVNTQLRLSDDRTDVVIAPGDWIVGDLNGVVCIPQGLAFQVAEKLESAAAAEARIEADIASGAPFAESSKRHRS